MWYFIWSIGLGLAVSFGVLNALWLEKRFEQNDTPGSRRPQEHRPGACSWLLRGMRSMLRRDA